MNTVALGAGLWLALIPAQPVPKADALGDPLPDGALLRLGTVRFRHPSSVSELALSPDGRTVVTAGPTMIAWDTATGKERWRADPASLEFRGSSYGGRYLAFTPDGRLVTPGRRGEVVIRNPLTGDPTSLVPKRSEPVPARGGSIDVAPDGKSLALGSEAGLTVCDLDGRVLFEVANVSAGPFGNMNNDRLAFGGHFTYAVFAPRGNVLAVVTSDTAEAIRLHDAKTGAELRRIALAARLVRLAFAPDGQTLFATERDQAVRAYAAESGKRLWATPIKLTNPFENYTSAVAVRPDGKLVAVGATDNHIYLLDAGTGELTGRLAGHGWYPWGLAFTADGATLYSAGWDGPVRRWDVATRKQLPLPRGVRASAVVAASRDGGTLAFADDADVIRIVDGATGAERRTIALAGASHSQLAFSPDGRRLAGGGSNGENVHVAVWDLSDGKLLHRWDWPKGRDPHSKVECLAFTPDGSRLAAALFRQSGVRVWDLQKGSEVSTVSHSMVYGLSFSPDGRTLATAGWDRRIRLWDPDTGKVRRELEVIDPKGGDARMYTVCYAPAGGLLATAHLDGQVRVWDAADLTLRGTFREDGRFVFGAVAFSPDGLWLATGTQGGQVHLWDPRSGKRVWDRGRHAGYVYTVGFAGDGRTLLSGANDGVGYLWDLRPTDKATRDAAGLWDDLSGPDGPAAYRAVWALADAPDRAVNLLREKLRIEPPADPDRVRKLIVELDDPKFAVRSAAQAELSKLGARAAGPLRAARARATSAEQRDRLDRLLSDIAAAAKPAEVRNLRAVTALSWAGTPEARRLLEEWAKADPDGPLGKPAAAALDRAR